MNISEIAALAGVSKAAVSRYFNEGYLSEEKRAQIKAAVEKTGYRPTASAQNLRTRVTHQIGVVIPKLSSESCARVVDGISRVLREENYQLILANTENDPEREIEYLDFFRHDRVDGVILLATVYTGDHRALLQNMRVPVVIVGQKYDGFDSVYHDDYGAARALTAAMLEKGCRRPGFIGVTPRDIAAGQQRRAGFEAALKEHALPVRPQEMRVAKFEIASGYEQARLLLQTSPDLDCILCATDSVALGALEYCRETGRRVPDQLLLCGVGDTAMGRVAAVPLTTAHLHYHTSGAEAARRLLHHLHTGKAAARPLQLEYRLVARRSTEKAEALYIKKCPDEAAKTIPGTAEFCSL